MGPKTRAISVRKRQEELIREVEDMSTQCELDAMCVIYNRTSNGEPAAVWPADPTRMIMRYTEVPEDDIDAMDIERYLIEQNNKVQAEIASTRARNKEMEFDILMSKAHSGNGVNDLNLSEVSSLEEMLRERIARLRVRAATLNGGQGGDKGKGVLYEDDVQGKISPPRN
ncbi:hypothetical protein LINPERPRIM_LOCUS10195 [Linum perenne]